MIQKSAHELAVAIVAELPEHSWHTWLRMLEVEATFDADSGRCPRCGRALPIGSVGPAFGGSGHGGGIGIPRMPGEIEAACLVDGMRAHSGRNLPLDELLAAVHDVHAGLVEKGWKRYGARFDRAFESSTVPAEQAEAAGQQLERLRRFGPGALERGSDLEVLVTSLAHHWPRRPASAIP